MSTERKPLLTDTDGQDSHLERSGWSCDNLQLTRMGGVCLQTLVGVWVAADTPTCPRQRPLVGPKDLVNDFASLLILYSQWNDRAAHARGVDGNIESVPTGGSADREARELMHEVGGCHIRELFSGSKGRAISATGSMAVSLLHGWNARWLQVAREWDVRLLYALDPGCSDEA